MLQLVVLRLVVPLLVQQLVALLPVARHMLLPVVELRLPAELPVVELHRPDMSRGGQRGCRTRSPGKLEIADDVTASIIGGRWLGGRRLLELPLIVRARLSRSTALNRARLTVIVWIVWIHP